MSSDRSTLKKPCKICSKLSTFSTDNEVPICGRKYGAKHRYYCLDLRTKVYKTLKPKKFILKAVVKNREFLRRLHLRAIKSGGGKLKYGYHITLLAGTLPADMTDEDRDFVVEKLNHFSEKITNELSTTRGEYTIFEGKDKRGTWYLARSFDEIDLYDLWTRTFGRDKFGTLDEFLSEFGIVLKDYFYVDGVDGKIKLIPHISIATFNSEHSAIEGLRQIYEAGLESLFDVVFDGFNPIHKIPIHKQMGLEVECEIY